LVDEALDRVAELELFFMGDSLHPNRPVGTNVQIGLEVGRLRPRPALYCREFSDMFAEDAEQQALCGKPIFRRKR
jgi:hypothetical protein